MKKERILLAIGLLLVSAHYFIAPFYSLPDFVRGILIGAGLGLEIIALVLIRRKCGSICKNQKTAI